MPDQPAQHHTSNEIYDWSKVIDSVAMAMHDIAKNKGWYDPPKTNLEAMALIHSEVSEASEELRGDLDPTMVYFTPVKPTAEPEPEAYEAWDRWNRFDVSVRNGGTAEAPSEEDILLLVRNGFLKPEGFGVELADAVIRIFDTASYNSISLGEMIRLKSAYNRTRPHRHGGKKA